MIKNIFETILNIACKSGNFSLVNYLISLDKFDLASELIFYDHIYIAFQNIDINYVKKSNIFGTLLHYAVESGNIDIVKYLISLNKINISSKDILINKFLISFHMNIDINTIITDIFLEL